LPSFYFYMLLNFYLENKLSVLPGGCLIINESKIYQCKPVLSVPKHLLNPRHPWAISD